MIEVLYIGDSETVISRYAVGADVFEQAYPGYWQQMFIWLAGRSPLCRDFVQSGT